MPSPDPSLTHDPSLLPAGARPEATDHKAKSRTPDLVCTAQGARCAQCGHELVTIAHGSRESPVCFGCKTGTRGAFEAHERAMGRAA